MKIRISILLLIACMYSSYTVQGQFELLMVPYRCGALWGFSDTSGTVLITPTYDSISYFSKNYYLEKEITEVNKNGKMGVIDGKGAIIIPIVWDSLYTFYTQAEKVNALIVKKGKAFGVISFQSDIIIPTVYDALESHDFYIEKGNFIDYDYTAFLAKRGKAYYSIDLQGKKTVVTEQFYKEKMGEGYGNIAYYDAMDMDPNIQQLGFKTFVQANKNIVDSISIRQFHTRSRYYIIYKNNKQGLVHQSVIRDMKREEIIAPIYDEVLDVYYTEGIASHFMVRINGYISVIDIKGNVLMPFKYKGYSRWCSSFVFILQDGKEGYYDLKTGYELLPEYEDLRGCGDKFRIWKVKQNGVWTFMTDQKRPYVCK